jgi:hypothetical protein
VVDSADSYFSQKPTGKKLPQPDGKLSAKRHLFDPNCHKKDVLSSSRLRSPREKLYLSRPQFRSISQPNVRPDVLPKRTQTFPSRCHGPDLPGPFCV